MLRLIGFVVVLAAIVFGLGLYLDWFSVSKDDSGDTSKLSVTVDKEKVSRDAAVAKEKAGEMVDKASAAMKKLGDKNDDEAAPAGSTVEGSIMTVDADEARLVVANDDGTMAFVVADGADVRLNGREVPLADLRLGDAVEVDYEQDEARRVAHRVSATRQ